MKAHQYQQNGSVHEITMLYIRAHHRGAPDVQCSGFCQKDVAFHHYTAQYSATQQVCHRIVIMSHVKKRLKGGKAERSSPGTGDSDEPGALLSDDAMQDVGERL